MDKMSIIETLTREKDRLSGIIQDMEKRLSRAPEGAVRIIKHRNGYQYYFRKDSSEKTGKYMPKSEYKKAVDLMQKKYDLQIKTAAEKQYSVINHFLNGYDPEILKRIYASLSEPRQNCILPVEISDEEYIKKWSSEEYTPKIIADDIPEQYTDNGERVRSKSEVMIADALKKARIPYRYECPLKLGSIVVHPDFTILRIRDRQVLYWEHLGMMDDPDYLSRTIRKIREYERHGIYPGVDLILTVETSGMPINLNVINGMIKTYCI